MPPFRFPSAKSLAKISHRAFKQREVASLEYDMKYYGPDLQELEKRVKEHAKQGYSILSFDKYLSKPIQDELKKRGFEVTVVNRNLTKSEGNTNTKGIEISWYETEKELK
jgi:hypothetical protein